MNDADVQKYQKLIDAELELMTEKVEYFQRLRVDVHISEMLYAEQELNAGSKRLHSMVEEIRRKIS